VSAAKSAGSVPLRCFAASAYVWATRCSAPVGWCQLGWNPTGPDLLTDLHNMDYSRIERGRTMNLVDEASFLSFRGSCPIRKLGADADLFGVLVDGPVPRGAGAAAIGSSFG